MNQYDELTDLFSKHYVSQQQPPTLHPLQQTPAQAVQVEVKPHVPQPIVYSITQHYHHSSHHAPPQRPTSTPTIDAASISRILAHQGVDASTLLPAQLSLFAGGTVAQQMRLVELWRISPPEAGGHAAAIARNFGVWPDTSFQREEELAQLRYETSVMAERAESHEEMMGDDMMSDSEASTSNAPITPILGGDGRWNQASHVEPYMMSGYEALAAREYEASMQNGSGYVRATDSIYKTISDVHHYPNVGTYVMNDESRARSGWCGDEDDMML